MKNVFLALLLVFLGSGCAKTIYVPVERKTSVKEIVRDTTIDIRLEREYVREIVPDTTSILETKYAKATAIWHGDKGTLEHGIENKDHYIPVKILYVDREIEIEKPAPYPVEVRVPEDRPVRMPLRWYEKVFIYLGIIETTLVLSRLGYIFRKK